MNKKYISILFFSILFFLILFPVISAQTIKWVNIGDAEIYGGGQEGADVFYNMSKWIVEKNPDFVMQSGDLVNGWKSEYEYLYPSFQLLKEHNLTYFISRGNPNNDTLWEEYFGNLNETQILNFNETSLGILSLYMDNQNYEEERLIKIKEFALNNSNITFLLLTHWYQTPHYDLDYFNNVSNIRFVYSGHLSGQEVNKLDLINSTRWWFMFADNDDNELIAGISGLLYYNEFDLDNNSLHIIGYSPIRNITYIEFEINLTNNEINWIKELEIIRTQEQIPRSSGGGGSYTSNKINKENKTMEIYYSEDINKLRLLVELEKEKEDDDYVNISDIQMEQNIIIKNENWFINFIKFIRCYL